jgi:hypothetical protein
VNRKYELKNYESKFLNIKTKNTGRVRGEGAVPNYI